MTRFFFVFFLFSFTNAVGVVCHCRCHCRCRCHNRFRCHPAIIIVSLSPSFAAVVIVILMVIVIVVVASKKNALQKRKFVDVQKSGRGSSRGLFVDNMYRTIIINTTKNKMKRLGTGTGTGQRTTYVRRYAGPVDRDGTSKVGTCMYVGLWLWLTIFWISGMK